MNIIRKGIKETPFEDFYHRMLRDSWGRFFAIFFAFFLFLNVIFATLYSINPESVAHLDDGWFSCFAFSVQTMATIGYGYMYPATEYAHIIVMFEAVVGIFFTALLTGMVFAKFAKPMARIIFSNNALFGRRNGKDVLMLRLANARTNRIYEARATLTLLRPETTVEGESLRRLVDLKLERNETPIFALSWSLYHIIDETSPLYKVEIDTMIKEQWEVIVTFSGLDQDLGTTLSAMQIYPATTLVQGKKFVDIIHFDNGIRTIDFSKIHALQE